jgi:hypothetical protein
MHPAPAQTEDDAAPGSARILAQLDRLAQRVRLNGLGHRRLAAANPRDLTTALLRDIDETILPRQVRVTTDAGQSFTLDISGRRLMRLVVPGSGGVVGEPEDPCEAARALAADLRRSLQRATELTLQTQRMDANTDRAQVGSSAEALAAALGIDLEASEGERGLDRLLRNLRRHSIAALVFDGHGRPQQRIGAADDLATLETLAAVHLQPACATLIRTLPRNTRNGCMLLGAGAGSGRHALVGLSDKHRVAALLDRQQVTILLPVLQDIFAPANPAQAD